MGVATPVAASVAPNAKKSGFHLSRYIYPPLIERYHLGHSFSDTLLMRQRIANPVILIFNPHPGLIVSPILTSLILVVPLGYNLIVILQESLLLPMSNSNFPSDAHLIPRFIVPLQLQVVGV